MHRPDGLALAAMRDNILNLKRDAVIMAAQVYYNALLAGAGTAELRQRWRTVYYNVCDLVQEEARHG